MKELSIGDEIIYCPPYVRFYTDRYKGVVISISKDKKMVTCKLGFGVKYCKIEDVVKLNNL